MRRFEFQEAGSAKFWEVWTQGHELLVRFGRLGTAGQTKSKAFADAAAAAQERDKLIREKTAKGYAEVTVPAGTGPAVPVAAAAVPAPAPAPAAAAAAAAAAAPLPVPSPAPAAPSPSPGPAPVPDVPATPPAAPIALLARTEPAPGFDWTPALRAELPALRGVAPLARPLSYGWLDYPIEWRSDRITPDQRALFARLGAPRGWAVWSDVERTEALADARLAAPDAAHWQQALVQTAILEARLPAATQPEWIAGLGLDALVGVGLARHGLPWMLELMLAFVDSDGLQFDLSGAWFQLRKAIVVCSDTSHDALLQRVQGLHATPAQRHVRAYLFPHRADWVAAALADPKPESGKFRLRDSLMSAADARRYLEGAALQRKVLRSTLLLQLHLHGPAALGLVARALELTRDAEEDRALNLLLARAQGPVAHFLRAFRHPRDAAEVEAAIATAPAHFDRQRLRDALARLAADADGTARLGNRHPLLQFLLHAEVDTALPLLADKLEHSYTEILVDALLMLLGCLRTPALLALILRWRKKAPALDKTLEKLQAEAPEALMAEAARLLAAGHEHERALGDLLLSLAPRHPERWAAVQAELPAPLRQRLQARVQQARQAPARSEDLPDWLRQPPWTGKRRKQPPPRKDLPRADATPRLDWLPGERERHHPGPPTRSAEQLWAQFKDFPLGAALKPLMAGQPFTPADTARVSSAFYAGELARWEDTVALPLWNHAAARLMSPWSSQAPGILALLARFGEAALPGLRQYLASRFDDALLACGPVADPALLPPVLRALRAQRKAGRPALQQWLRRQVEWVVPHVLPLALGPAGATREDAVYALRWLASQGLRERLASQADALQAGPELAELLDTDPMVAALPARLPTLPVFFQPATLMRPLLREGGGALPAEAVESVGLMLAMSSLDLPYPGLALLKQICTPDSLADFAWDLFEAWQAAAAPSKEAWAFQALGLLGNDDTARRLTPLIRAWPSEGASARAATGLDLLAAIGTDVALMHLNGVAERVKSKPLQEKARARIAAVAEALELSPADLADRLVPDFGLDESGGLTLDFGPRRFSLRFDEALKPVVLDAQGQPLKDLPAPRQDDDAERAAAAVARYKQIRKDLKAVAAQQLPRLEQALVQQRRWSAATFAALYPRHALMRHVAARLLWGVYDEGEALRSAFRIAEDWSLADVEDDRFELPELAKVGLVHPLDLEPAALAVWTERFADYEILQPFQQLARAHYRPDIALLKGHQHREALGRRVKSVSLLGLLRRGWEAGDPVHAGQVADFGRPLPGGGQIALGVEPGFVLSGPNLEPVQTIVQLELQGRAASSTLADLGAVGVSELWRDIELLEPAKG